MHIVLEELEADASLSAFVLWINMLPEDENADLRMLVDELANPRIQWFHDPKRLAGKAVAAALGGIGQTAWDVYIAFDASVRWDEAMPPARDWVHQLGDPWADPSRRHVRDKLEPALKRMVAELVSR